MPKACAIGRLTWLLMMANCAAVVKGDPVGVVVSSVYCVEVPEVGALHMDMLVIKRFSKPHKVIAFLQGNLNASSRQV